MFFQVNWEQTQVLTSECKHKDNIQMEIRLEYILESISNQIIQIHKQAPLQIKLIIDWSVEKKETKQVARLWHEGNLEGN